MTIPSEFLHLSHNAGCADRLCPQSISHRGIQYEALSKHYNTPIEFWKEDKEDVPDKIEEYSRYRKTRNAARKLIDDAQGLFAGGSLSDEDKYKVIKALEQTFWKVEEKIDGNPFD